MTEATGKTQPTWEEYYRAKRDEFTHALGKLEATDRGKYDPVKSDSHLLKTSRDLLDIDNIHRRAIDALKTKIDQVEQRMIKIAQSHLTLMDKGDAELKSQIEAEKQDTTRTLKAIQTWMENWEPLLKLVREDYHDKLDRVENIGEHE